MRSKALLLAAALLAAPLAPALASVYRIDDSASTVSQAVTPMRWHALAPGRAADHTVEGQLNVAVRLNVASWLNRQARIYMTLAPTDGTQLGASWRTQGHLLAGSIRGGGRTLVYQGPIRQAWIEDTLVLALAADGRSLERAQSLQFNFEIEVSP